MPTQPNYYGIILRRSGQGHCQDRMNNNPPANHIALNDVSSPALMSKDVSYTSTPSIAHNRILVTL